MPAAKRQRPLVEKDKRGNPWVVVEDFAPGWTARFKIGASIHFGMVDIVEVRVVPNKVRFPLRSGPPAWEMSSRVLRSLPISKVAEADLSEFITRPPRYAWPVEDEEEHTMPRERRALPDAAILATAVSYDRAVRDSKTRNSPARAVAEELSLSRSTARNRIHKARNLGFLTKAKGMGERGGELTKKALLVLKSGKRKGRKK